MTEFKQGQKVHWASPSNPASTILAGPFNVGRRDQHYVIRESSGYERWVFANDLEPVPPVKVGDVGYLAESPSCPTRIVREINDDYVVCELTQKGPSVYSRLVVDAREDFDKSWRPQS